MLARPAETAAGLRARDGERFLDAVQNARVVAPTPSATTGRCTTARPKSWNLRDRHMFETLVRAARVPRAGEDEGRRVGAQLAHRRRAGDRDGRARRAERRAALPPAFRRRRVRGRLRHRLGDRGRRLGLGRPDGDHGGAALASAELRAPRTTPGPPLPAPAAEPAAALETLAEPRLERAIGVIYRPETELASHYFQAVLTRQFDEYVWFEKTRAIRPLDAGRLAGVPETYPFGL